MWGWYLNWKWRRLTNVYVLILLLAFLLDGVLMKTIGAVAWHEGLTVLPNTTLIWLFLAIQFQLTQRMPYWWYVILVSILFDLYYIGTLGLNTLGYIAAVWAMLRLRPYFNERLTGGVPLLTLGLLVYLMMAYCIGILFQLTNLSIGYYLVWTVGPTIIFNIAVAALVYYFAWTIFQRLED